MEGGINATWQFNVSGAAGFRSRSRRASISSAVRVFRSSTASTSKHTTLSTAASVFRSHPRRTYRTPNVYQLDLQLSRDFVIGSKVTVTPILACFNLLDSHTVLARDGCVGTYDAEASTVFEPE